MAADFPPLKLRIALVLYRALWWLLLPVILIYLLRRGRKDPVYKQHMGERFGRYSAPLMNSVWIHAVSMGEMRSATPLIRTLLDQGETVVTTHFTPAGRREALRNFGPEIVGGRVVSVWVPFEYDFALRRFLRHFAPKYGLVMEIEIWPVMIMACRNSGTPLFMCNAQYPEKSFQKDRTGLGLRAALTNGFAGAFVKSGGQQARFAAAGMSNLHITGELRFDQPIPPSQIQASAQCRDVLVRGRPSITLTSVVAGEDDIYIDMIRQAEGVFFTYVPRAPERFEDVANMLEQAGVRFARRSELCDADLVLKQSAPDIDVLLGDSLGEMYFYLGLCDRAIVGGGFTASGAHNIIEPLALKKPVIVGPEIWTVAYPAHEAIAAGVCQQVADPAALLAEVQSPTPVTDAQIDAFYNAHAGATERTLAALPIALSQSSVRR